MNSAHLRIVGIGDVRHGRDVHPTVALEQTLVSERQEREPIEIVLVVDLDAFRKARRRVAGDDQADAARC